MIIRGSASPSHESAASGFTGDPGSPGGDPVPSASDRTPDGRGIQAHTELPANHVLRTTADRIESHGLGPGPSIRAKIEFVMNAKL